MRSFNQEAYDRAVARRDLALTDLEELSQQVEDGEIDDDTAAELRAGYDAELAGAEAALAELGPPPKPKRVKQEPAAATSNTKRAPSERGQPAGTSTGLNTRLLVGAGILIGALVVILISVQNSSAPEATTTEVMPGGTAGADPCAELAAALNDHADSGFRLALADCYSDTGNAMSAIEHYRTVANSSDAPPTDVGRANVGLGYLNLQIGEVANAADYMRAALESDQDNVEANYFLGMMLIYDLGDPAGGVPYLESALEAPNLPDSVILEIETALAVARGEGASS